MTSDPKPEPADLDGLASEILALTISSRLLPVAIAGPPGSGKSTLAAALCSRIGPRCCVVPMDGFHLDNATLEARGLLSVKGAPETFDLAGFKDLIDALVSGATTGFPTFDRDLDSVVAGGGNLPEGVSVLLFEGNYLLFDEPGWADLAQRWHAGIWLDVAEDVLEERLARRWLDQGMSREDALARARMNDLPNARRVMRHALPATWTLAN